MRKTVSYGRAAAMMLVPIMLSAIALFGLYNLQIIHGDDYYEQSMNAIVSTQTVPASRGSIFDRNGRVLVSNRIGYNISIDRERLVAGGDPNGTLLTLTGLCGELGQSYTDTFPVSAQPPFTYNADMSQTQRSRLDKYLEHFDLSPDISAPELIVWLREHYSVPGDYTDADARVAIGVRYELETRTLFDFSDYVFASDVDMEMISAVKEYGLPGVSIETTSVREYHTKYAAHILGVVGLMDEDEYAYYKESGYPMNAKVGKYGVEQIFEEYLHGTDGKMVVTRAKNGTVIDSVYTEEPKAGNNVTLSLDIRCQKVAEDSLARIIEGINAEREENEKITGGAVVAIEVGTGDVIASASYPTFSIERYFEDYAELSADPSAPLYNRATKGTYSPGSTYKMNTAIAALQSGVITTHTQIYDYAIYNEYSGYEYKCWAYPNSHGMLNVTTAIQNSCNYFFYKVGVQTGIDTISHYAALFGLGQPTGIELEENTGVLATREYKETVVGESWYPGDTLLASIGQSYNLFTPMQLASYAATLASNGTRYAAHLLKCVKSYDNSTLVNSYTPQVLSRVEADQEYFDAVKQGMLYVSKYGSPSGVFGYYQVDVASKTGTVQLGEDQINNAVFIAFAPYDNPEIAVSVVIEGGSAGAIGAQIARDVFDYWLAAREDDVSVETENSLLK
ncbi:MAG: penicillin-binding transpeptidase domain-containing protein [Clostridiales bacterium]|nr:penicillin-binding transpeptidase domain-containing protein [Clostridiales bacterium]